MTHHQWDTVSHRFGRSWKPAMSREHLEYLVAHSFADTQAGRINAHRMVEYINDENGPYAAFTFRTSDMLGDVEHHIAIHPSDICCAQARTLVAKVRDSGWIDQQDFTAKMLPQIHEAWNEMSTADRMSLLDMSDVPMACLLETQCPEGLLLDVQALIDA